MTSKTMFVTLMTVMRGILPRNVLMKTSLKLNPVKTGGDGYVLRKFKNNVFHYDITLGVNGLLNFDNHNKTWFDDDVVSNRAYVELVTTVTHECKHILQYESFLDEACLNDNFHMACVAFVCSFNADYYYSNYHSIITEMDAEIYSLMFSRQYFSEIWGREKSDVELLRMINSHCGKRGHDGWFFPKLYDNVIDFDKFLHKFEQHANDMCFATKRSYNIYRSNDFVAVYLQKHSDLLYAWNMCKTGVEQDVFMARITANLKGAKSWRPYFPFVYDSFHGRLPEVNKRSGDLAERTNRIFELAKKLGN